MKMSEMVGQALMHSGQFVITPDLKLLEFNMNLESFMILVRQEVNVYRKYIPFTWNRTINMGRVYTFTNVVNDPALPMNQQILIEQIPQWISSVIPVETYSVPSMGLLYRNLLRSSNDNPMNPMMSGTPVNWVWKYERPKLYVPYDGAVDVTLHGDYLFVEDRATGGSLRDVDWPGLEYDSDLLDLISAKFMISLGRSRRAFVLTDIPVQIDTDALVTEGKELYDTTLQQIRDRSHSHLSVGN